MDDIVTPPVGLPSPRICNLCKWENFSGYGFNLHAEKGRVGQYIGKVDENSPAEYGGLETGMRVVEVNGVNIVNENHQQVVQRVKMTGGTVQLLVVDRKTDSWCTSNKIVISQHMPEYFPDIVSYTTPSSLPSEDEDSRTHSDLEDSKPDEEGNNAVIQTHIAPSRATHTSDVPMTNGRVVINVGDDDDSSSLDNSRQTTTNQDGDESHKVVIRTGPDEPAPYSVQPHNESARASSSSEEQLDFAQIAKNEALVAIATESVSDTTERKEQPKQDENRNVFAPKAEDTPPTRRKAHFADSNGVIEDEEKHQQYPPSSSSQKTHTVVESHRKQPITAASSSSDTVRTASEVKELKDDPLRLEGISAKQMREMLKERKKRDIRQKQIPMKEKYKQVMSL